MYLTLYSNTGFILFLCSLNKRIWIGTVKNMNLAKLGFRGDSALSENAGSGKNAAGSSCGCCGSSGPVSIKRTREEKIMTNSDGETKTTVVTAPEIVCGGCAGSIKKALGSIRGVSEVEVDVATKRVTVDHDENVSQAIIVDALDSAGYSVAQ